MGAVEFEPLPHLPVKRALDIFDRCFEKGLFYQYPQRIFFSKGSIIFI